MFGATYGFDEYVKGILKLYNEGFVKTILLTGEKIEQIVIKQKAK